MENITIIMPIHEFNEEVKKYTKQAIESINRLGHGDNIKVLVISPSKIMTDINVLFKESNLDVSSINSETTDLFEMVNNAVKYCLTEYFTVMEFDDRFSPKWLDSFDIYKKANPNVSVYLPIVELYNDKDELIGFVNEIAWSSAFSKCDANGENKLGYIDNECLKAYMDFNVTGAFIRTEDFIGIGGLKKSLSIAAWYEMLMRFCNNNKNIYVIPKSGYYHTIGRANSYSMKMSKEISKEYGQWLIKTAQVEYKYNEEREIKFSPKDKKE